ncbi:HAD-IA family hydrolase [Paraglaciecola sp.]|uniref:HAD-IA family hydrolase n=1 Tax=Paraglaciecola sp. TaxID=1920173 RepID=UPI003EF930BF
MTTTPNAMLFDLDGTLLDTAPDLGNALNHILRLYKMPTVTYQQYRNIASDGAKGLLELGFGEELKEYDFTKLRQQLLDYYEQNICVDTCYFEGIETLLSNLNKQNIPWGIVTNKPEFLTLKLVKYFPLLENCAVIISGDSLPNRKPHPEPLLHAQKLLNIATPNTWYIGDAERDIQAANSANMVSVVTLNGYIDKSIDVDMWNPDIKVSSARELLSIM